MVIPTSYLSLRAVRLRRESNSAYLLGEFLGAMAIAFGLTLKDPSGINATLSKVRCALYLQRNISGDIKRAPQLLLQLCYYASGRNSKLRGKWPNSKFLFFFLNL